MHDLYHQRLANVIARHEKHVRTPNPVEQDWDSGVVERFAYPVITREHVPLTWRYDLNPKTNPLLLERLGVNATLNAGAILFQDKVCLVVRVEGNDRKSFFAIARSETGVDRFRFDDEPIQLGETDNPDTNVYDMRLTAHEDGWIYGLFCTERPDPNRKPGDLSAALAQAGVCRTKDLKTWHRLPDIRTPSAQQRNVVLHPEFVGGKYALYTRPADAFMEAGTGEGIGWALVDTMEGAVVKQQTIIDYRAYHTIKELKNGQGPTPIKTDRGWLHLAHGVRGCAAGMRYVLYVFVTDLKDPTKVIAAPGGHFLAPWRDERHGDVENVLFTNGWVRLPDETVLIYYASADTRLHVARTSVDRLVDYCFNTPADAGRSAASVQQRLDLIQRNRAYLKGSNDPLLKQLQS